MTDADQITAEVDCEVWKDVARCLASRECDVRRADLEDAFYALAESLRFDGAVSSEDVREARRALYAATNLLEEQLAPLAGCEPWESPPPMPNGKAREHYGFERDDE